MTTFRVGLRAGVEVQDHGLERDGEASSCEDLLPGLSWHLKRASPVLADVQGGSSRCVDTHPGDRYSRSVDEPFYVKYLKSVLRC